MIMIDHSKRLSQPLRWTRAGRLATIAASALLLAAVATVAVIASTSGSGRHAGCIEVTFASSLGAAVIHPCGARARGLCADPAENPAAAAHGALREACRQAGLPYGRVGAAGSVVSQNFVATSRRLDVSGPTRPAQVRPVPLAVRAAPATPSRLARLHPKF